MDFLKSHITHITLVSIIVVILIIAGFSPLSNISLSRNFADFQSLYPTARAEILLARSYNKSDAHTPNSFTVALQGAWEPVISARLFINSEERNVEINGNRPFEVVEENGVRVVRFLYTTVPLNALADGRHEARVVIVHGEAGNSKLVENRRKFNVDYNEPTIFLDKNTETIIVSDQGSGIAGVELFVINMSDVVTEKLSLEGFLTKLSETQTARTYQVQNIDSKKDYIVVSKDNAGNINFISLNPSRPAEVILKEIRKQNLSIGTKSQAPPQPEGNGSACEIHLKYFYLDRATKNFNKWWGKNPISGKDRKEEIIEDAQIFPPYTVPLILQEVINIELFPKPIFLDLWKGTYITKKLPWISETGLTAKNIQLPNGEIDRGIVLDWNYIASASKYFESKKPSDEVIPIVLVDEFVNSKNAIGVAMLTNGVIFIDYLAFVNNSSVYDLENLVDVIVHELGHIHGLHHISEFFNIMFPMSAGGLDLDINQAAAFMAHTQNCFDKSFEPTRAGTWFSNKNQGGYEYGCGIINRLIGGKDVHSTTLEQCDSTFSSGFNPIPGATQIELGAGTPKDPLSFCPIITDPGQHGSPYREVFGIVPSDPLKNYAARAAKFGAENITFCAPPPLSQQCTCLTREEATHLNLSIPDLPLPTLPPPNVPGTGDTKYKPASDPPPPNTCGNGIVEPGEQCDQSRCPPATGPNAGAKVCLPNCKCHECPTYFTCPGGNAALCPLGVGGTHWTCDLYGCCIPQQLITP